MTRPLFLKTTLAKTTLAKMAGPLVIGLALAGCGTSPPLHYYSITERGLPYNDSSSAEAAMVVELLPVAIPERLNREEIVLTGAGGALTILDSERWAAPLADEIRQSLDEALWRTLHATDVYQAPVSLTANGLPHYRIALRVERFDAAMGDHATVETSWTVRKLPQGPIALCRAHFSVPLSKPGVDVAVSGLTEATAKMANAVAASMDRLNRGATDPCEHPR